MRFSSRLEAHGSQILPVENYFNYFTEIEEHYHRRRGTTLLLSTLDWALIETWKNAGVPLEAVLRGIDEAFDKYDQRPSKTKKVNSLAYCSQAVLTAAEDMKEAAVGATPADEKNQSEPAFDARQIAAFLRDNADRLEKAQAKSSMPNHAAIPIPNHAAILFAPVARDAATSLRELAGTIESSPKLPRLEDLERRLTVLEEKIFAVLMASTPDDDLVEVRAQADRDLAPFRRNMTSAQIDQLHKQYVRKRLLEHTGIPRLSLFYMH